MSISPIYTVYIRVPFPRGDFVDPPPVEWDAAKERALWKVLSKASKNSDIDWKALATKFDVTEAFILQQAAWLYERQLSEVRAQMRKVGVSKSSTPSPVPSDTPGGETMKRTSSGGGRERAPSSLSTTRKDCSQLASVPNTPRTAAPSFPRTNSGNSIHSRILHPQSTRPTKSSTNRRSLSPPSRGLQSPLVAERYSAVSPRPAEPSSPVADESSSSESDSSDDLPAQSRILRRPARFQSHKQDLSKSASSADESPAFLPFTPIEGQPPSTPTHHDPSATLRGDPRQISRRTASKKTNESLAQNEQTSDSSTSSAHPGSNSTASGHGFEFGRRPGHRHRHTGPLSPRRTAELSRRSPGKAGSDGTPSMGSSFSDLDDASVTQSALEEALASNINAGTMASRMSSISHALRSRYL